MSDAELTMLEPRTPTGCVMDGRWCDDCRKAHVPEFVYFAQARDGLIKIGTSWVPERRIRSIENMVGPVRTLGLIRGNRALERRWHRRFADARQHGEWFTPTTELLAAIARATGALQ
jgi:hypothetical protein